MSADSFAGRVVALSGGIGGAKLALGLARVLPPGALTVVVNTGDDFRHLGLAISPDIDTLLYTLSGLADPVKGWGRRDETWNFMAALRDIGGATWFALGDADLALHVERTRALAAGESLTAVTQRFAQRLGIDSRVLPMSDDAVRTQLLTDGGWLDFQEYFVARRCEPAVRAIRYAGADAARPGVEVIAALADPDVCAIVICPSNPMLSIEPILALPGLREALRSAPAPVIAVSPIIGGQAVKGPTAKLLRELGGQASATAVAGRYADCIDLFLLDPADAGAALPEGVIPAVAPSWMRTLADRETLARSVLAAAVQHGGRHRLRRRR